MSMLINKWTMKRCVLVKDNGSIRFTCSVNDNGLDFRSKQSIIMLSKDLISDFNS